MSISRNDTVYTFEDIFEQVETSDDTALPIPPEFVVSSEEELLAGLAEADREYERGECQDVFEFLAEMREKYGI